MRHESSKRLNWKRREILTSTLGCLILMSLLVIRGSCRNGSRSLTGNITFIISLIISKNISFFNLTTINSYNITIVSPYTLTIISSYTLTEITC